MQAYSTIKGKSNSDDGLVSPPPGYTIRERQTASDDGFESFPEYHREDRIEDYEDPTQGLHSFLSNLKVLEDAKAPEDEQEEMYEEPTEETTTASAPGKKKRRKPITPKNKRKNKGKAKAAAEPQTQTISSPFAAALSGYNSPQNIFQPHAEPQGISFAGMQDPQEIQEMLNLWKSHPLGGLGLLRLPESQDEMKRGDKRAKIEAKAVDKEEDDGEDFEIRSDGIEFKGKLKDMTKEEQRKELLRYLGNISR